jgi:hypothetical protein
MSDKPQDGTTPTPPDGTPPKHGFEVDADGNVLGVWFSMRVDHFVEFTDKAIIDHEALKKLTKPSA